MGDSNYPPQYPPTPSKICWLFSLFDQRSKLKPHLRNFEEAKQIGNLKKICIFNIHDVLNLNKTKMLLGWM